MCPQASGSFHAANREETQVQNLYRTFIDGWNQRDSRKLAEGFAADGAVIGFDGSQHVGQAEIAEQIGRIFQDHPTPPFVVKVKEIRLLTADVAQLQAIVGMVPPQKSELEPKLNAIQMMTAVRRNGRWCMALVQNTPAAFHGRPEAVQAMTLELTEVYKSSENR